MTTPKRYWLVYYEQRRIGGGEFGGANAVTDQHPADYLARLLEAYPSASSRVTFALEISLNQYKNLKGKV